MAVPEHWAAGVEEVPVSFPVPPGRKQIYRGCRTAIPMPVFRPPGLFPVAVGPVFLLHHHRHRVPGLLYFGTMLRYIGRYAVYDLSSGLRLLDKSPRLSDCGEFIRALAEKPQQYRDGMHKCFTFLPQLDELPFVPYGKMEQERLRLSRAMRVTPCRKRW